MIPISDMIRVFGRIGLLSFGGPAAQIALMHKELVEDRDWLTEAQFLRALSFCMLLPGPEAMQLATYAGWRQRGVLGGLIGGGLFVIPGALVITVLALAYGTYGGLDWVQTVFLGVKATVVIIVIAALHKVAKKALTGRTAWMIAALAFVTLFALNLPFPAVILVAGCIGAALMRPTAQDTTAPLKLHWATPIKVIAIGLVIWMAPLLMAWALDASFLLDVGLYFSKLAVVTFGGAYAVLAYMTQTVVGDFGWLTTPEMMDALGLAETTPGPLILVTQFVGMVAGVAKGGAGLAMMAGLMTLWVTFVPCFIWIFAGAPLIDWLEGQPRLQGALSGITAAVVGVIANLSLWFALHVFFEATQTVTIGPLQMIAPIWPTLNEAAVLLTGLAAAFMFWCKMGLMQTLALTALAGLLLSWVGMV